MRTTNRPASWWGGGSPYGPFILVAIGLVAATLVLISLQGPRSSRLAPGAPTTAAPKPGQTQSPAPPARGNVTKAQPSPLVAAPGAASPGVAHAPANPSSPAIAPGRSTAAPAPAASGPSPADIEAEIIRLTNVERAAEGLPPLTHDPALDRLARGHSRDMLERGFFSHENPDGDGPTERAEKAGYNTHKMVSGREVVGVGENIGMMPLGPVEDIGFVEREARSIAAAQVRSWMGTRGHRSNILSEDYERIGAGVVYNGRGAYICTQEFW